MKHLKDLNIKNKTLLIRFDYNVPIEDYKILNDFRIKSSFDTINYCLKNNASIVIISHLGRPDGFNENFSLKPIYEYLKKYFDNKIYFSNDCISQNSIEISRKLKPLQIHLLENLRFYKEEIDNDTTFAEKLSKHADIYVCDSFGTSHRSHASNSKILKFFNHKCIGLLIAKEFKYLEVNKSKKNGVIIGGAKISTKIKMINYFLNNSDMIFIGGAMLFTFLKSKGFNVGKSKVENDMLEEAENIYTKSVLMNKTIILPIDVVCAKDSISSKDIYTRNINDISDTDIGLDIGPKTINLFMSKISKLKTIIWNGPLGYFENKNFANGTIKIGNFLEKSKVSTIIGGGDTVSALEKYGSIRNFTHVSTGGGASLKLLSGEKLNLNKSWEKYK